jgi:hypothetical protein
MGRAKEKILPRNKIKSEKKAAKLEDRERQKAEEIRQAAELKLVREQQQAAEARAREKNKKRKNQYLLREAEVPSTSRRSSSSYKDETYFPVDSSHGIFDNSMFYKEEQDQELDDSVQEERESDSGLASLGTEEEEEPPSAPTSAVGLEEALDRDQEESKSETEPLNEIALKKCSETQAVKVRLPAKATAQPFSPNFHIDSSEIFI